MRPRRRPMDIVRHRSLFASLIPVVLVATTLTAAHPAPVASVSDADGRDAGSPGTVQPAAPTPTEWSWQNPNMAPNPDNNIHSDSWFTDTYPAAGPTDVDSVDARIIDTFIFNDPVTGAPRFLTLGECPAHTYDSDGNLLTVCAGLPNPTTNQFQRSIVSIDPDGRLLAFADFAVGFDDFHQALTEFGGIGYFYLDAQERIVMGMPNGHIVTWQRQPPTADSEVDRWVAVDDVAITGAGGAVPADRGALYALVPSESGYTWFTTTGGVVGTVAPDPCTADCIKWLDINDPDGDGTRDPQPGGGLQHISESHSVDGDATFQQSDYFMYRFDLGPDGAPIIAWQESYDRGIQVKPGQTSRGSGTSPSYFELGSRAFVAIFDNAVTPHINVYRAEATLRAGEQRVVASIAPFGERTRVSDENSLVIYPGTKPNSVRIFAENNWGNDSLLATAGPRMTEPGVGGIEVRLTGSSKVQARRLDPNLDVVVPSVVSKGSIGADAFYTYEKRTLGWHLTALDPDDLDRELWSVRVGNSSPKYNNWYSQLSLAPDHETFYAGVPQGLIRMRPTDGPPPPDHCSSVRDAQDIVVMARTLAEWDAGPVWGPDYVQASFDAAGVELARAIAELPDGATDLRDRLEGFAGELGAIDASLASVDYDVTRLTPQQKQELLAFAERHAAAIIALIVFFAVHCTDIELDGDFAAKLRILLYRAYLPTGGFDAVPLPEITLVRNGTETTLPSCPTTAHGSAIEAMSTTPIDISAVLSQMADSGGIVPSDVPAPWCSWWGVSSVETLNIAAPDANAAYWYMPLIADDDLEIRIDGEYPDDRYMSLALYTATADPYDYDGVSSTIPDYLIDPNPGSLNPWQVDAAPGGDYRVTITADPSVGQANVLPWYSTDPSGTRATMPTPCGDPGSTNIACPLSNMFMSPPQDDQAGIFSNVNNRYMMYVFDPGQVYVLRGKAPRTPTGTHPVPWPDPQYDLRYFSICDIVYARPYPAVVEDGCAVDMEIPVDGDGSYTIVVSTEADRPSNATLANGVVWIKAAPLVRNFLVLRHMLPSDGFAEAAQNVPQDAAWTSAFTTMGAYYPTTTVTCNTAAFEVSPAKCFVPPPPGVEPPFDPGGTVGG